MAGTNPSSSVEEPTPSEQLDANAD